MRGLEWLGRRMLGMLGSRIQVGGVVKEASFFALLRDGIFITLYLESALGFA